MNFLKNRHMLKLLRFGIVGIINVILTLAVFVCALTIGVSAEFSVICSAVVGIFFSSFANNKYTFEQGTIIYGVVFIGVYILTVSMNILLLNLALSFGHDPIISQMTLTLPIAVLTFLLLLWSEKVVTEYRQ